MVANQVKEKTTNKEVVNNEDDDITLVIIVKGIIQNKEIEEHAKKEGK